MGHVICSRCLATASHTANSVTILKVQLNGTELKSILGLSNIFGGFVQINAILADPVIPGFASVAFSLNDTLQIGQRFNLNLEKKSSKKGKAFRRS